KTSIFSHPVYLFLRKFSLQDFRGGSTIPDFSFITTIKNGKVTGMRHVAKGEHLMTFDAFKEIAERAGYLVIHSDNLRSMTLDKLMVMGKKSAISVANSAF
ncbi:hypothetical protein R9K62_05635, partial [Escherichia coli]